MSISDATTAFLDVPLIKLFTSTLRRASAMV